MSNYILVGIATFFHSSITVIKDGYNNSKANLQGLIWRSPILSYFLLAIELIMTVVYGIHNNYLPMIIFGGISILLTTLFFSAMGVIFTMKFGNFNITKQKKGLYLSDRKNILIMILIYVPILIPIICLHYLIGPSQIIILAIFVNYLLSLLLLLGQLILFLYIYYNAALWLKLG